MDTTEVYMKIRAFTVKAHWGLLIRSGIKTCENRTFRAPPGFYLVHASSSLSFSEWCYGVQWVHERFGSSCPFPAFDVCRLWCGQVLCGVKVVAACTESNDRWYLAGKVAWELDSPVLCERGVFARGNLGAWPVSDALLQAYHDGVRARHASLKVRV